MTFREMTKKELIKAYADDDARASGEKGAEAYEHLKKILDEGYKLEGFAGVLEQVAAFTARTTDLLISGGHASQYPGKDSAVVWCAYMYNVDAVQQLRRVKLRVRAKAKLRAESIARAPDKAQPAVKKPAAKKPAAKA